jgi:hypothetical protein
MINNYHNDKYINHINEYNYDTRTVFNLVDEFYSQNIHEYDNLCFIKLFMFSEMILDLNLFYALQNSLQFISQPKLISNSLFYLKQLAKFPTVFKTVSIQEIIKKITIYLKSLNSICISNSGNDNNINNNTNIYSSISNNSSSNYTNTSSNSSNIDLSKDSLTYKKSLESIIEFLNELITRNKFQLIEENENMLKLLTEIILNEVSKSIITNDNLVNNFVNMLSSFFFKNSNIFFIFQSGILRKLVIYVNKAIEPSYDNSISTDKSNAIISVSNFISNYARFSKHKSSLHNINCIYSPQILKLLNVESINSFTITCNNESLISSLNKLVYLLGSEP